MKLFCKKKKINDGENTLDINKYIFFQSVNQTITPPPTKKRSKDAPRLDYINKTLPYSYHLDNILFYKQ